MRVLQVVWIIAVSVFCTTGHAYASGTGHPEGTRGLLEVEYTISSGGKKDHQGSGSEWKLEREISMRYELVAGKPQSFGRSNPGAAEKAGRQGETLAGKTGAASQSLTSKHAPTLEELEKMMDACGDDDACVERIAKKMMKETRDPSSALSSLARDSRKELTPLGKEIGKVEGQMPKAVIQPWGFSRSKSWASGTFTLNEKMRNYDSSTCVKGKEVCDATRTRSGKGAISQLGPSLSGDSGSDALAPVEVDTEKKQASVMIPNLIGGFKVQETTVTDLKGQQKPKQIEIGQGGLPVSANQIQELYKPVVSKTGDSVRDLNGKKEIVLKEGIEDYGGPTKITVRWKFSVLR